MENHPYRPSPDVSGSVQASLQEALKLAQSKNSTAERQLSEALTENTRLLRENVRLTELAGRMPVVTQVWEHKMVDHRNCSVAVTNEKLNKAGLEGWEMVSSTSEFAFFKRPLVVKPK